MTAADAARLSQETSRDDNPGCEWAADCRGRGAADEHPVHGRDLRQRAGQARRAARASTAIADQEARSAALFGELGKVLTHPRCVNCHPAGDRPRQGEQGRLHQPPVVRGADGHGLAAMRCSICHQSANFDPARVPGHPEWHLAPREMAWEGKTLGEICEQIKDPARNGNRSLEDARPSHRHRHPGRLGLGARLRPSARSRHAAGGRRAGRCLGQVRRGLPAVTAAHSGRMPKAASNRLA